MSHKRKRRPVHDNNDTKKKQQQAQRWIGELSDDTWAIIVQYVWNTSTLSLVSKTVADIVDTVNTSMATTTVTSHVVDFNTSDPAPWRLRHSTMQWRGKLQWHGKVIQILMREPSLFALYTEHYNFGRCCCCVEYFADGHDLDDVAREIKDDFDRVCRGERMWVFRLNGYNEEDLF